MSQFQNPEVFPSHKIMFMHVNIGAHELMSYALENVFYFQHFKIIWMT